MSDFEVDSPALFARVYTRAARGEFFLSRPFVFPFLIKGKGNFITRNETLEKIDKEVFVVSHVSHPMFCLCVCIRNTLSHSTNKPKLGNFHGRTLIFPVFSTLLKRERERGVIRMVSCEKSSSSHQSHPSAEKYLEILSNFVQLWFCRFPHNRPYVSPLTVYNTNPHSSGITLGVFHLCFFSIMMMMILINELFV